MTAKRKRSFKKYNKKEREDIYQTITDQVIEAMQDAEGWKQTWTGDSQFPSNARTGKLYNGINTLLLFIASHKRGCKNQWITFKQAKELGEGVHVKKGSKSEKIVFYKQYEKEITNDAGEKETKETFTIQWSHVFSVSDLEGLTQEQVEEFEQEERHLEAQKLIDDMGLELRSGSPSYTPSKDFIRMPESSAFQSLDAYYTTYLHELSHATGHEKRCDREMSGTFGKPSYAREELIAELSSAFLSKKCGLNSEVENHASYLNSWIKILKEDKRAIFKASSQARKASDYIIENSIKMEQEREKKRESTQEEEYSL